MAVSSTHIARSSRTKSRTHTRADESRWRGVYSRFGARIGFTLAALALLVGWLGRDAHALSAERGLGYALGIVAVSCMLVLLLYPLRKRWRVLRLLGPTKNWFRLHMILGIIGPMAALYHCNFSLGSLNSRVALFSALTVAASGIVGRYLYVKIHHGLYGRRANLKELLAAVKLTPPQGARVASFIPELMRRIAAFDRQVLVPPKGIFDSMKLPIALAIRTRWQYFELMRFTRRRLIVEAVYSPVVAQHSDRLEAATRRYVAAHLRHVRRVAEFNAYERLFSLWHAVHLPFFFLLVATAVIHVIAVHAY